MMEREVGNKSFPIWLMGDSEPKNWQNKLATPLDPRHPARHNIWTPVLDAVQDQIFRSTGQRIDTSTLFIRNAIGDPAIKPRPGDIQWQSVVNTELVAWQSLIAANHPCFIFTFGSFAFEFARRARDEAAIQRFNHWGALRLGEQFRSRIQSFDPVKINIIPLLHVSISRGRFIESHEQFCQNVSGANYFDFVGNEIAHIILKHCSQLPIWVQRAR